MFKRSSILGALAFGASLTIAFGPSPIHAQNADGKDQSRASATLGEIVVTANRREQDISDVQASVEVISQADLQRYSGATVIEALRDAVGVDARSSGANSDVTIRGQIPNAGTSVLILVDGLPRTAKYGVDNLNLIGVETVERVEVIRGPMSALYGANAAGGVINIITKDPEGTGGDVRVTAGSSFSEDGDGRETLNSGATAFHEAGDFSHRVSVDMRHARPFTFDDEIDDVLNGIKHYGLAYRGRWHATETDELTLNLEGFKQDDRSTGISNGSTYTRREEETRFFSALSYAGEVGPGFLTAETSYGHTDGSANRAVTVESTDYEEMIAQGRYFLALDDGFGGTHSLLAGSGFSREEIEIDIYSRTGERDSTHVFLQDEWVPADWISVVAGLRVDHFSDFGTHAVPRVTVASRGSGMIWRLGYGQAYRAPSVIEQYSEFTRGRFLIRGSEDVEAEESTSYEAALGWRAGRGKIEAIYHYSDIDNLIESVSTSETTTGGLSIIEYQNIAEATIQGIEIVGDYLILDSLSVSGSYAYLDAEDGDGNRLEDRARHTFKASATYQEGPWSATVRGRTMLQYYAPDPDVRGSSPFNSDYATLDLNFGYQVSDRWRVSFGVDNVFDEQVPVNYASNGTVEDPAGRYVYLTTKFSF